MDLQDLISAFAVALGIGLLIGLERGWRTRDVEPGRRAAGIRTFAITGLLGGTTGALAVALGGAASAGGGIVVAIGFASYAAVLTLFTLEESRAGGSYSATTAIAGMLTFALSAYAVVGDMRIAAAAAVAAAGLLALREQLHGWVEKISWPELRSGLVLLTMTFIGLPIMPNEPVGPFGGVNPREVWIIAIVLAAVSFLGYAAVKYFGARRGLLLAAAAGGLASSTAVTIANARHAARGEGEPRLLAAGVAVASGIMFLRVAAIVTALNPSLLILVAPALAAATADGRRICRRVGALAADRRAGTSRGEIPQSIRVLVGRGICLVPGSDHRARARGRGNVRRDRRRHGRDRRSGWPTSTPSPYRWRGSLPRRSAPDRRRWPSWPRWRAIP